MILHGDFDGISSRAPFTVAIDIYDNNYSCASINTKSCFFVAKVPMIYLFSTKDC